jgi:4-hydroxyphenylpyruvate dioxygenase
MLTALGFIHAGEHRSKQVSLWRQGGVNLVINRDAEGWAHSHWKVHGASVCALALRVDSVEAALARAAALDVGTFEQRVSEGELAIPWIRGVGGALSYFTEGDRGRGHWTQDFRPVAATAVAQSLGLARIDHLAQSVRIEEFLSWQLHYTSLFDVRKAPPVEIPDTLGLVQSQAIESPDGTFRVTLNGSAANQTLAARFVQGEMGAGDIMAAARHARANGVQILPVPPNYYDDLEARFGLSAALIEQLRAADVFYDRDETGEYLQMYTRAFAKRFFFEIVERRGYSGYGAVNAGVRLAAQARYKVSRLD